MNPKIMRYTGLFCAAAITASAVTACSADHTAPVMVYQNTEVTEAMYTYWMSAYKNYYLNQVLGVADTASALDTEILVKNDAGEDTNMTIAALLTERIGDIIETNCMALYLFDFYALSLPDSIKNDVERMVSGEIENAGGRKALNEALAPLGLNVNILRELYTADEKINYLYEYLYGNTTLGTTGAEPISVEAYNDFYEENYVCVKHIYIRTNDKNVLDENGNTTYDENGALVTAALTEEEQAVRLALVDDLMTQLEDGADFDTLMQEYSMDANRTVCPDGYVIGQYTAMPEEFIDAAFSMEIGEIRRLDASYATHIMLRTPLPENGWQNETYLSTMGEFKELIKSQVFDEKIAPMRDEIIYDKDLVEKLNIYDIPASIY